jgi:peptidoglycan/LPS O-acetylase OafA/YrhL
MTVTDSSQLSDDVAPEPPTSPKKQRLHLGFLDGIRGVAALFVVMHHVWQFVVGRPDLGRLPHWFKYLSFLTFGQHAVVVFIVVSGYCLMMPVARSADGTLSGGIQNFVKRRARRILPPYYAALVISCLCILFVPALHTPRNTMWDIAFPALTPESLVSHLLLVHNLFRSFQWTIDPPLWTVALEWQIYFVFALILLPLWRRFGTASAVIAAFAIGIIPAYLHENFACTWFLGAFSLGMLAALFNFDPKLNERIRSAPLSGLSLILTVVLIVYLFIVNHHRELIIITETFIALNTALFLAACTQRIQSAKPLIVSNLLGARPMIQLGSFSYSLYLVHYPLLAYLFLAMVPHHLHPIKIFALLVFPGIPLILLASYIFHRAFELPFMSSSWKAAIPVRPNVS